MTLTTPMIWIEAGSALYIAWQASCHINHQSTKTWFLATAYWALLGGAAAWSLYGVITGRAPDPLRVSLLVLVALGTGFDRRRFDRGLRLRYLRRMRQRRGKKR